ncbi:MAG: hypothetical protein EBV06_03175 [Planctomycetia bacterium]|nr:hypothetical protein [Planctomycetia bacterium]
MGETVDHEKTPSGFPINIIIIIVLMLYQGEEQISLLMGVRYDFVKSRVKMFVFGSFGLITPRIRFFDVYVVDEVGL